MTEEYKRLAKITTGIQRHHVFLIKNHNYDYDTKYYSWLQLMGLIETWDVARLKSKGHSK